ncbi:MAG: DNA mismatch repair protein MutS [Deltaproteobacteria bacterium]|nr:DNA mismatch repair protein MutS [Deltaproteobacteria bacterium]
MTDPAAAYAERKRERTASLRLALSRYAWVSNARLLVFLAALVLAYFGLKGGAALALAYAAGPIAIFLVLIVVHDRVASAKERAERAVAFYDRGLSHLDGSWPGRGNDGLTLQPAGHPYAPDLDIFGKGSLFELLCGAQTKEGRERLAAWLLAPATALEAQARQPAVAELAGDLDLREALHENGAGANASLDARTLLAWANEAPRLQARILRVILPVVTAASVVTLLAWIFTDVPAWPFLCVLPFVFAIDRWLARDIAAVTLRVSRPLNELKALQNILKSIERRTFSAEWLRQRVSRLATDGMLASERIGALVRLVEWYDSRRNQLFAPFAYAWLWGPNFALAIEKWRRAHGRAAAEWLLLVGDVEALASLAAYRFEQPSDVFPEIADGPPRIEATALGHPLLARDKCVANDVMLLDRPQIYVVSGSNMSGKSTYMRTIGTNVVLALAGAPVRAASMRVSPLHIGASLRVQDSLQEGASRFYAEIRRLKQVMDLAAGPLLFLLDEILAGTNSHDRRVGTEAVLRTLVNKGAIGVVTTHDLALTEIATALSSRAKNVHFEDHMEGATLVFDYKMRDGVVQKSNAIALMRAVGLEV